ncbi:MAG: phosphoenolpyruvate carboxykinase (ATP) [Elusimicrobia bacterium]|nr:phosphoenolpyruvate carboxykinase (ATP) [Elusimicrobiota bacterium]
MKDILDVKSEHGLEKQGFQGLRNVYWNLSPSALYEEAISRKEGRLSHMGALLVDTGRHTGRSANDKFIVKEPTTAGKVWWGEYNRPFDQDKFNGLYKRLQGYLQGRDLFVQDCYGGADPDYRLPARIVTERAWHSLFARNMLIKPASSEEYRRFVPEFTVVAVPSFQADPKVDGTRSGTFILVDFSQRLCLIGGTGYGGEIKKSVFSILNYLLPLKGVLPMHCSANIGPDDDAALFFGLSGTGKTTLSADPQRRLIGDDEHGWSDAGVFNFEDGCYAKVIRLSPKAEPQITSAIRRFGAILENVPFDPVTRLIDLDDESRTENTRASYPLDFIANAVPEKTGGHPRNIIFLTCDAFGVLPPIAKLTPDQALYQFISGYTSKVAGTEAGLGKEPQPTFSTCFGAPFMVQHPAVYADLLKRKVLDHGATCWLVNTGWVGGPYGVGQRISIRHTRGLLDAVLSGRLRDAQFAADPVFGFGVPKACEGIPAGVLNPSDSWPDQARYAQKYRELAARFVENFKKFESGCPAEVRAAGPKL